jgi:hypothetical protein
MRALAVLLVLATAAVLLAVVFQRSNTASASGGQERALTLVGPVRVSFDDSGLDTTGVELFSPAVDTIIYSAWYMVETPWRCEVDGEFCGDPQLYLMTDGTDRDLFNAGEGEGNYLLGDPPPLDAGNDDRLLLFGQGGKNQITINRFGEGRGEDAQLPAKVVAETTMRARITTGELTGPPAQGAADFYFVVSSSVGCG